MANKSKSSFVCSNCGSRYGSWSGKCQICDNWGTLEEEIEVDTTKSLKSGVILKPKKITDFENLTDSDIRITSLANVDQVLGGGFVRGGVVLMTGQPGIGKSTLLLQISSKVATNYKVLYATGEESDKQVALRARRLGCDINNLEIVSTTDVNSIALTMSSQKYDMVIIDSIQTMLVREVMSSSGSIAQINATTNILTKIAKENDTALLIIGHVTKEGNIAGPKVLEHMVDVVINLEGDRYGGLRVLRSIKNRYGPTNESSIMDMEEHGLIEVDNPSAMLLEERSISSGSIVLATMEGNRPLLVEVQALTNKTNFGMPRRAASGYDLNRLNLLVAIVEKTLRLNLSNSDIYINIIGGLKITEPAADLAICIAIMCAFNNTKFETDAVVFGEVGLAGEIRFVNNIEKRIDEATKLGFLSIIGPRLRNKKSYPNYRQVKSLSDIHNLFNN